jgi:hypothetical protein
MTCTKCDICNCDVTFKNGHLYTVHSTVLIFFDMYDYSHLWLICDTCSNKFAELTHTKQIDSVKYIFDPKTKNAQDYADFAITCELKNLERLLKISNKNDDDNENIKDTHEHLDALGALYLNFGF